MPEQTIIIAPGNRTTLSLHMPNGTTIYNQDSNNAIWVGSNASLVAGQGMRIGPKGSLQWTTDNAQCFAVVDTGVASNVTVLISDNVQNLVNPVDVAAATAAQLLATGIPNVLTGTLLFDGQIGAGFSSKILSGINGYASLTIKVTSTATAQMWNVQQNMQGYQAHVFQLPQAVPSNNATILELPVRGDLLSIGWTDNSQPVWITVIGTNRALPLNVQGNNEMITYTWNQAMTFPTKYFDPQIIVSNGKPWYGIFLVTGGNFGFFGAKSISSGGLVTDYTLVDSKQGFAGANGSQTEKILQLPIGVTQLYFQSMSSATFTAQLTLVPTL
jgi:hypothetical protein